MMMKKVAKKGMIPAGYANGGKAMKEEEGKGHAKKEMAALKKGGASKSIMMSEAKEYGMKMANGGKAKLCPNCKTPKACANGCKMKMANGGKAKK